MITTSEFVRQLTHGEPDQRYVLNTEPYVEIPATDIARHSIHVDLVTGQTFPQPTAATPTDQLEARRQIGADGRSVEFQHVKHYIP